MKYDYVRTDTSVLQAVRTAIVRGVEGTPSPRYAGVAELVYAADSKPAPARVEGSSPSPGTDFKILQHPNWVLDKIYKYVYTLIVQSLKGVSEMIKILALSIVITAALASPASAQFAFQQQKEQSGKQAFCSKNPHSTVCRDRVVDLRAQGQQPTPSSYDIWQAKQRGGTYCNYATDVCVSIVGGQPVVTKR